MRSLPFALFTRLIPVALVVLAIQRTVCAAHRPAGVAVQVVLALAAGAGAGAGAERGAFAGFALGMMYDLGVGTPLGLTALAYGLAGLVSGYVHQHHSRSAVVAGGDLRGHRFGGRRGGDPGRQVPHRPGRLVHGSAVRRAAGRDHRGDGAQPVDGARSAGGALGAKRRTWRAIPE